VVIGLLDSNSALVTSAACRQLLAEFCLNSVSDNTEVSLSVRSASASVARSHI
jgi:hypothetical protein